MIPRGILPAPPPVAVLPPSAALVSAKLQLRRSRRPRDSPDNIYPEELAADFTALKTSSTHNQPPFPAQAQQPQEAEGSAEARVEWRSGQALSGSDVLMAMQRAAAVTAARKSKKRIGGRAKRGGGDGGGDEGGGGSDSDVRPLNIRSDWARRLDEMERALQKLLRLEA